MPIQWNLKYAVGDAQIDSEHMELFRLANRLVAATTRQEQAECASGFYAYTRKHFKHEEDLMFMLNYHEMQDHIAQHADLIERLDTVTASIARGSLKIADVIEFVNYWLLKHIKEFDTKLAVLIKNQFELKAQTDS